MIHFNKLVICIVDECYKELQIDSNENLVQPKLEELISNQILDFSEVVSFAVNNNIENST